ncbi:ribosomal L7Ae/L30e/S12e/Gadd45 family protein [Candidatus Woesearchaeota archaeon]|nr:ribosomal L7Ae/L30e/S12e/Gadd45 family protein [Candidatus Woesearchaeota archaeon]
MADTIAEIKKLVKEEKLIIGADETVKLLKAGAISRVYLAANCPAQLKQDIEHYAGIGEVEVVDTGLQNEELGDICKKPFKIAVMGLKKE